MDRTVLEKIASVRNIIFVGPVVRNTRTKTQWQCQHGHQWWATYTNIRNGSGCPWCANEARRTLKTSRKWKDKNQPAPNQPLGLELYRIAGADRGIVWADTVLPNSSKASTLWRCAHGHEWNAPYTNIVFSGSGCPVCAMDASRLDYRSYLAQGYRYSLEYLGPLPPNTRTPTWWKCQSGHHFLKRLKSIQGGVGCPVCRKLSYAKNKGRTPSRLLLCDGVATIYETRLEAEAGKEYFDVTGCGENCTRNHKVLPVKVKPYK